MTWGESQPQPHLERYTKAEITSRSLQPPSKDADYSCAGQSLATGGKGVWKRPWESLFPSSSSNLYQRKALAPRASLWGAGAGP